MLHTKNIASIYSIHISQDEAPPSDVVPPEQGLHAETPAREHRPAGHGRQPSAPKEKVPAGHREQLEAEPEDQWPIGHAEQVVDPARE